MWGERGTFSDLLYPLCAPNAEALLFARVENFERE
eukprot:COSAG06_NODE_70780_length_190_cov_26.846154_1_plen_34_part_01